MRGFVLGVALAFTITPDRSVGQREGLRVDREPPHGSVHLDRRDIASLPSDTIRWRSREGGDVVYRAVSVAAVLARAGSPLDSLRIGRAAWVVIAEAADGYRVVFSAAELEDGLGPTRAWLAYARQDGPLESGEGPYRLLVPTDRRQPRSAHRIVRLRVVAVTAP